MQFFPRFVAALAFVTLMFSLSACGGGKTAATSADAKAGSHTAEDRAVDTLSADASRELMARGAELNRAELQRASNQAAGSVDVGKAMVQAAASSLVTAYRFYNTETGAHFYTINETERQNVQNTLPQFLYEGPAFYASGVAATGLNPVYRFFNEQTGVHFYTISEDEKALLLSDLPQFKYEGIAYYASKTEGSDLVPLFRFYLGSKGFHFYSNSATERDNIIATLPQYQFEGIGYYVLGADWGTAVGRLPHSGVGATQCYQANSTTLVPCSGTDANALNGQQDGHRADVHTMSYSEIPNPSGGNFARTECVKDAITGLVWEGKAASGQRAGRNRYTNGRPDELTDVSKYVEAINASKLCGYADWRVPSRMELSTIVDYGVVSGPSIRSDWFPNTATADYWARETFGREPSASQYWFVNFDNAWGSSVVEGSSGLAVRLVRGRAFVGNRYSFSSVDYGVDTANNVVDDAWTGLQWRRCSEGQTWSGEGCTGVASLFTHEEAMAHAGQQIGWRLPNIKELTSLSDPHSGRYVDAPAVIDSVAFPDTPDTWFWTSTAYVRDATYARYVDFEGGFNHYLCSRQRGHAVRLVRVNQ